MINRINNSTLNESEIINISCILIEASFLIILNFILYLLLLDTYKLKQFDDESNTHYCNIASLLKSSKTCRVVLALNEISYL